MLVRTYRRKPFASPDYNGIVLEDELVTNQIKRLRDQLEEESEMVISFSTCAYQEPNFYMAKIPANLHHFSVEIHTSIT